MLLKDALVSIFSFHDQKKLGWILLTNYILLVLWKKRIEKNKWLLQLYY